MSALLALRTSTSSLPASLSYMYHDVWQEIGDPRVTKFLFFESGPWNIISVVLIYLYFVLILGPRTMKHRKPFDLRSVVLGYNIFMVALNGYMFWEGMKITNYGTDAWGCNLVDTRSNDPRELKKLIIGHLFFMSKIVELLDTVIFVLRKKSNQITLLHVVHHSLVPLLIWTGYKISPGGNMALFPLVNSLIHVLMYTYYGLTIVANTSHEIWIRDSVTKFLWWKKYLTRLQMAQFVLVMVHSLHVLFVPSCNFPKALLYMSFVNALLFLVLFASFYRHAYGSSMAKKAAAAKLAAAAAVKSTGDTVIQSQFTNGDANNNINNSNKTINGSNNCHNGTSNGNCITSNGHKSSKKD